MPATTPEAVSIHFYPPLIFLPSCQWLGAATPYLPPGQSACELCDDGSTEAEGRQAQPVALGERSDSLRPEFVVAEGDTLHEGSHCFGQVFDAGRVELVAG